MAGYVELFLDQGATFNSVINIVDDMTNTPLDLTNFEVQSQMRRSYYSSSPSANIKCVVSNASNGEITMSMTAANTSNIKAGRYLFDLKTTDSDGNVNRAIEGIITVTPNVTR